jgi:hypothetical protein
LPGFFIFKNVFKSVFFQILVCFFAEIYKTLKMECKCIKIKKMRRLAKKALCALIILFSSISGLYAANSKGIKLNIQGTGSNELVEGFKYALKIEATAAGYDVTDNMIEAKYLIKFTVAFDQVQQKSKFNVSLVKVADSSEVVAMEYLFTDEEEMLLYSQLVFFMLMANLPEDEVGTGVVDNTWRDKWLYVRASFDYSVMLLALKGDGLLGGLGMFNDDYNPPLVSPLDNKVVPVFGVGLGAEVQVLDFLSVEPGGQLSYENAVQGHTMFSLLASLSIKFPLKFFSGFVPEPYIAAAYSLRFPEENEIFINFPMLAYGGGIQVSVKMEKNSALFFEAGYMFFGDVGMKNKYTNIFPKPEIIKYDYSLLSFKIGYKYGFFNRKKKD